MTTGVEILALMKHSSRPSALSRPFAFAALLLGLGAAIPARAELVILVDGNVMKVAAYEAAGDQAQLTFPSGGRMTMAIERVDRVIDDEYTPEPDPPQVAQGPTAETVAAAVIPLRFEEKQAKVPDGPYGTMIYEAAKRHSINPQVVAALIRAESAGNSRAVSNKGARGLMQLMPATAERFGVHKERLLDPKQNIEAGITYLSWLIEQFPGDLSKVLAAYNAGENAVWRYNGIPPYRETREYVRRIFGTLGLTAKIAGL
ncbi:MAG TPA: lytic transglycosylase domain-containing protein [Thermoanaerobaculia bacterium]|nr:lytic transglycosylase domain-containing protein [Thermoanaerobaculia bacterium]